MTPMSERALEMGCFCSTRLMAQPMEVIAQTINKNVSMLEDRHAERGREQIQQRARKQKRPGEMHELIVTETRQGAADPNISEEQQSGLAGKPEDRCEISLQERNREQDGSEQSKQGEHRKSEAVAF